MVLHTCNASTGEGEAEESQVQTQPGFEHKVRDQPELHSKTLVQNQTKPKEML
jgi:hypothetical protein